MTSSDVARHRNLTKQIGRRKLLLVDYNLRRTALPNDRNQAQTDQRLNVFRDCGARLNSEMFGYLRVGRNVTAPLQEADQVVKDFFLSLGAWESRKHIFLTNRARKLM